MSACNFPSSIWVSNMTTATSANVTATRPTGGTAALTTTISTGVPVPTGGGGGESAAMRTRVFSAAGALCVVVAGAVVAL